MTESRGTTVEVSGGGEEAITPDQRLQDVYIVASWFTALKALMGN